MNVSCRSGAISSGIEAAVDAAAAVVSPAAVAAVASNASAEAAPCNEMNLTAKVVLKRVIIDFVSFIQMTTSVATCP